ncbi:MAG: YchF/TatD family DNA exonuclease [Planctomycetes bacterium]|nr:YchF/TatD family DNA exonuclease [Planctomycetota bacterium]
MLIDTHAHLARGRLADRADEVIAAAVEAGVGGIICATADLHDSKAAVALARRHENVRRLAGVHPHAARDVNDETLRQIEDLAGLDGNCIAIGEIGLDYHYDNSPRDDQQRVFAAQLDLARRLDMPVVIHTREAFEETMSILRQSRVDPGRVMFHSFTGDAGAARAVLDYGAAISYSGIATFKKADDIRKGAAIVPADRILAETDAPFLSPEPVRNMKANEPANVVHVARRLAQLRGASLEDFARQTTTNAERLFGITMDRSGI